MSAHTAASENLAPIGAVITYRWNDEFPHGEYEGYVSFGDYDERTNTDGHGHDDDDVFYYSTKADLLHLSGNPDPSRDWTLVSIDAYRYAFTKDVEEVKL